MNHTPDQAVEHLLKVGLKNLWYPICPASFIKETPIALRRLGQKNCAVARYHWHRACLAGPLSAPWCAAVARCGAGRSHLLPVSRRGSAQ